MAKIAVLSGGDSDEREVSLRSGAAVAEALKTAGHEVQAFDTLDLAIETLATFEVVFPALHGLGGEDGSVQAELEEHSVRYVGSDVKASILCFDKSEYKRHIAEHGLLTPQSALVHDRDIRDHPLAQQSFVLKPYNGGSSVDTFIVRDPATAPWEQMMAAMKDKYGEMLLEQLIEGIELTVGVLGDEAIGIIEIIPPADGEFDYENKYNGATQELCPPVHVADDVQSQARELGLKAHQLAGCRDFSRTDIMYETATGKLYVLETNTIPGMTDQSLFPKMAAHAGMDMPALCDKLVGFALNRKN